VFIYIYIYLYLFIYLFIFISDVAAVVFIFLLPINLQGIEFVCKMVCVTSYYQILERERALNCVPQVSETGAGFIMGASTPCSPLIGTLKWAVTRVTSGWCVQEMYYVGQRVFICGTSANYTSQAKFHFTFCTKYPALTMLCKRTTYRIVERI